MDEFMSKPLIAIRHHYLSHLLLFCWWYKGEVNQWKLIINLCCLLIIHLWSAIVHGLLNMSSWQRLFSVLVRYVLPSKIKVPTRNIKRQQISKCLPFSASDKHIFSKSETNFQGRHQQDIPQRGRHQKFTIDEYIDNLASYSVWWFDIICIYLETFYVAW